MNEEHFVAKYSPLGIDLQVIAYQATLNSTLCSEPVRGGDYNDLLSSSYSVDDSVESLNMPDLQNQTLYNYNSYNNVVNCLRF